MEELLCYRNFSAKSLRASSFVTKNNEWWLGLLLHYYVDLTYRPYIALLNTFGQYNPINYVSNQTLNSFRRNYLFIKMLHFSFLFFNFKDFSWGQLWLFSKAVIRLLMCRCNLAGHRIAWTFNPLSVLHLTAPSQYQRTPYLVSNISYDLEPLTVIILLENCNFLLLRTLI